MGISRRKSHICKLLRRFFLHNSNGVLYQLRNNYAFLTLTSFVNDGIIGCKLSIIVSPFSQRTMSGEKICYLILGYMIYGGI